MLILLILVYILTSISLLVKSLLFDFWLFSFLRWTKLLWSWALFCNCFNLSIFLLTISVFTTWVSILFFFSFWLSSFQSWWLISLGIKYLLLTPGIIVECEVCFCRRYILFTAEKLRTIIYLILLKVLSLLTYQT